VVTCIICILLGHVGESTRSSGSKSCFNDFPKVTYRTSSGLAILPLSLVFVGMISFNNLCLQYVEVSFYNVARCLSLVFNVIFTYLILNKSTGWTTCATLLVVILGFILGINGEINFSLFGTSAGVISSIFVSLNSIFTSKMLAVVDNDKSLLLYYNNFNAAVLFVPLIALFESHVLMENLAVLTSFHFWVCMTLTGVMGFLIGLVTVMQVKATSPLTHNISGTAKAAAQSLLAFYIWGNEATFQGIAGILLVIFGSGLYTWVQISLPPPPVLPVQHDKPTALSSGR
jgi:GDP-fucose transporter C1